MKQLTKVIAKEGRGCCSFRFDLGNYNNASIYGVVGGNDSTYTLSRFGHIYFETERYSVFISECEKLGFELCFSLEVSNARVDYNLGKEFTTSTVSYMNNKYSSYKVYPPNSIILSTNGELYFKTHLNSCRFV